MRNLFLIILLFLKICIVGQQVISTQGDSYFNTNGGVDFTIGEVVIITGTDGVIDVTQGFHQSSWAFTEVEDFQPSYQVSIFPNPVNNDLYISTSFYENVDYMIYDELGKLILINKLLTERTTLQVGHLAPGAYIIFMVKEHEVIKSFKLFKNQ